MRTQTATIRSSKAAVEQSGGDRVDAKRTCGLIGPLKIGVYVRSCRQRVVTLPLLTRLGWNRWDWRLGSEVQLHGSVTSSRAHGSKRFRGFNACYW